MVRSPFPGWSAIQWRDIVPGAQTERRGGAGPVRGLLGGKDPTGRFSFSFCRTFLQTALFLVLLRTHQFPRLRAEVPNRPPDHVARTNRVPSVDLLVRLIEPAAGFRLVMLPFLLGQVFLRGELGVSQRQ